VQFFIRHKTSEKKLIGALNLRVFFVVGYLIKSLLQKLSDNMISIDFSNVAEGVYIVHYSDNEGNVFTNKVVVKR